MSRIRTFIALLLIASTMNLGCYRDYRFKSTELKKLNGYKDQSRGLIKATSDLVQGKKKRPNPVMRDVKGRRFTFDEDTELIFRLCCGHPRRLFEDTYRSVNVPKNVFQGVTHDNQKVKIPLKQIQWVDIEEFDGTSTVLLVVAVVLVVGTIGSVIVLATGNGGGGGGSDWDWD